MFRESHEMLIEIVTIMGMVGIPTLFAIATGCIRFCVKHARQINILMKSQQAQMRSNLLEKYHFHMNEGYISEDALEDWENQYQSYHELGTNGILDARREQLFKLPNKKG